MVAPLLVAGGLGLAGGVLNYFANRQQANAARDASAASLDQAREAQRFNLEMGARAQDVLSGAQGSSLADLYANYSAGMGSMAGGYEQGNQRLAAGYGNAQRNMLTSRGASTDVLSRGAASAYGSYGQGLDALRGGQYGAEQAGLGALSQYGSTNVSMDPGMSFRQQQGEQAIKRQAAAAGGRVSGRTLQALAGFNQDLASQEYGNAWQRANTQEAQRAGALGQLAGIYQGGGAAEAGLQSQLAGMQYGAGRDSSNIQTQYGMAQYAADQALAQQLSGNDIARGVGAYNAQTGYGSQLANLRMGTAGQIASGYTGVAQQNMSLTPAMMQANQAPVQYAGAGFGAAANTASQLGQLSMISGLQSPESWGW